MRITLGLRLAFGGLRASVDHHPADLTIALFEGLNSGWDTTIRNTH
jgi:hypothetical protein